MKLKYSLLLVLLCYNLIIAKETNSLIKRVISNILNSLPNLKKELSESIVTKSKEVTEIINGGFLSFSQSADIQYFEGVSTDNLNEFLKYLSNLVNIPKQYEQNFVDTLSLVEYSEYSQVITYRLIYSIDVGGDCKYLCILGQRNEENNLTDWLLANISAKFKLAPDVFIVTTSKSYLWGIYETYENKIISRPKSIDDTSLNTLVKFFEVLVFERFGEVLRISSANSIKFLE